MIGVIYLGDSQNTRERLKYIPGQLVRMTTTYKDAAKLCIPKVRNEHFILFFERNDPNTDVTAITYLKKKCPNVYIILLTEKMNDSGVIVCEHEPGCRLPEEVNGFTITKSKKYGKSCLTFYRKPQNEENEE